MRFVLTMGLAAALAAGCSHTGLGAGVRDDITKRMQTVQDPIAACYATQLKKNRKLKGTMTLSITAAAGTGQFDQVKIVRDEPGDPDLGTCVVLEVSKLKLAEPTKSPVEFEYPLTLAPTK